MNKPPVQPNHDKTKNISPSHPSKSKINKRCHSVTLSKKDLDNLIENSQQIDRYHYN